MAGGIEPWTIRQPEGFEEPLTKGSYKGMMLDRDKFDELLNLYYEKRRWDERGIPKKGTIEKLKLSDVATELEKYVTLSP